MATSPYLAKRAIRAPGGRPIWVLGPHPGEEEEEEDGPWCLSVSLVRGIDRYIQTWHTDSPGVTTDHALWPNRRGTIDNQVVE